MDYTPEQYKMLERFEKGLNIADLTESEMQIFWFLDREGLLLPHADVEDGLFSLSEKGKQVLFNHQSELNKAQERACEASKKEAKEEKQQRFSNKIAIANLTVSLASFFVGLVVEFYAGIYASVVEWWPKFAAWFSGLFH